MQRLSSRQEYPDPETSDPHVVAQALVDGMPLSRVPKELHESLLIPLSSTKNESLMTGDSATVKRIQIIMRSLSLGQPTKKRPRTAHPPRPTQPAYSPEAVVDQLLEGLPMENISGERLPDVIAALQMRRSYLVHTGEYGTSQKLENLVQEAKQQRVNTVYMTDREDRITQLNSQLYDALDNLREVRDQWKEIIEKHEEEKKQEIAALEEQHQRDLEEFDHTKPDVLPANYRKLSPSVLQLREQEKHLVLTHRYEEAIVFRDKADTLETEELQQQKRNFLNDFSRKRRSMVNDHLTKVEVLGKTWDLTLENDRQNRDRDVAKAKQLVDNLRYRIMTIEREKQRVSSTPPTGRALSALHPRVRMVAASRLNTPTPRHTTRARTALH